MTNEGSPADQAAEIIRNTSPDVLTEIVAQLKGPVAVTGEGYVPGVEPAMRASEAAKLAEIQLQQKKVEWEGENEKRRMDLDDHQHKRRMEFDDEKHKRTQRFWGLLITGLVVAAFLVFLQFSGKEEQFDKVLQNVLVATGALLTGRYWGQSGKKLKAPAEPEKNN